MLALDGQAAELVVFHARGHHRELGLDDLRDVGDTHRARGVELRVQVQVDLRRGGPLQHPHAVVECPRRCHRVDGRLGQGVPCLDVPRHRAQGGLVEGPTLQEVRREVTHVKLHAVRACHKALSLVAEQMPQSPTHDVEELCNLSVCEENRLPVRPGRVEVADNVHCRPSWSRLLVAEHCGVFLDLLHPEAKPLLAPPTVRVQEEGGDRRSALGFAQTEEAHVLVPDLGFAICGNHLHAKERPQEPEEAF
mmetsp:Transcript_80716/g.240579  ORF Transcript_80716/g.240579 Transcript_80716/m.240579 type:complete len:250 (+) Transcript_80716:121-870(+)